MLLIVLLLVVIISLAGAVLVSMYQKGLSFAQVVGVSMYPTYKPGEILIVNRKYLLRERDRILRDNQIPNGIVAVFRDPDQVGKLIIKRIAYTSIGTDGIHFWILGDNELDSRDSREFGFVSEQHFIGEVVKWKHKKSHKK